MPSLLYPPLTSCSELVVCSCTRLELVACIQTSQFMEDNDLLPNTQHGFRQKRSTMILLLLHLRLLLYLLRRRGDRVKMSALPTNVDIQYYGLEFICYITLRDNTHCYNSIEYWRNW